MLVTTFEHNRRNISKNIVKLNLKQNTNFYCIIICLHMWKGNIFLISVPDKTDKSLWNSSQLRVIFESVWYIVGLIYICYNLFITRLIHKFKTTGWLQGHLSLSSFWDGFNEYQGFLLRSKLSPHSGSV